VFEFATEEVRLLARSAAWQLWTPRQLEKQHDYPYIPLLMQYACGPLAGKKLSKGMTVVCSGVTQLHDVAALYKLHWYPSRSSIPSPRAINSNIFLHSPDNRFIMIYNFGRQSEASIASLHHNCQLSFERLSNLLGDNGISEGFRNDRGRYRVWAGNAGAHRIGRVSLDHRLREAPNMKHMVIELLADLNQALNDGTSHASASLVFVRLTPV